METVCWERGKALNETRTRVMMATARVAAVTALPEALRRLSTVSVAIKSNGKTIKRRNIYFRAKSRQAAVFLVVAVHTTHLMIDEGAALPVVM